MYEHPPSDRTHTQHTCLLRESILPETDLQPFSFYYTVTMLEENCCFPQKNPTIHPPFFPLYHFTLFSYGSLRSSILMLIVNSKVKKQLALKEDTIGIGREGEAAKRQRRCQRAGRYDTTVMTFCAFTEASSIHTTDYT